MLMDGSPIILFTSLPSSTPLPSLSLFPMVITFFFLDIESCDRTLAVTPDGTSAVTLAVTFELDETPATLLLLLLLLPTECTFAIERVSEGVGGWLRDGDAGIVPPLSVVVVVVVVVGLEENFSGRSGDETDETAE